MTALAVPHTIAQARPAPGRRHLSAVRQHALITARLRILWIALIFAVVALAALLQIIAYGFSDRAAQTTSFADAMLAPRAELADRNGVPLARAYPAYALWYNPGALGEGGAPLIKRPDEVAAALVAIFPDLDRARLIRQLASGQAGYLRRRVLPEDANRVMALGELALELPRETQRHYPQGSLAAHVLGFVDNGGVGHIGMEEVLDKQLTDPVARGKPVDLSIDLRVQGALEDELRSGMLATNAKGAAGIILDADTGEVIALASLPDFDPNRVVQRDVKLSPEEEQLGELPASFNRATNQVYELGSTFKPLTVAAAIDAGVIRDFARRYPAAPLHVAGFTIHDDEDLGSSLNVPETLIHSSNIVSAQIADELGGARLRQTMIDLGMNARPYIELPARGMPIWPGDNWPRLRTMTIGFGHGIAVTPLHLASAYAALVNGGIWRPATLLKLAPGTAPHGRRVFKASTSARMRQLLRMITVYGTGRSANAEGYRVGGKTGSAEKPGKGGYRRHALISTFASAFPMDAPRYVVVVMIDEPQGTEASSFQRTAAFTAAPVVGKLVPRIGPILGIRPDDSHDIDLSDLKPLVPEAQ